MATATGGERVRALVATLGLLVWVGCGADAGAGSPEADADAVRPDAVGLLESHTPTGVQVTLSLETEPVEVGPVRLDFTLDTPAPDPDQVTVDLVAPLMPAHGIVRFPTRTEADTRFVSEVEIPMEGLWEIYLNLDTGQEAAAFEIDVAPGQDANGQGTYESPRGHEGRGTHEGHSMDHGTP